MSFNHKNIIENFHNVTVLDNSNGIDGIKYIFSNKYGIEYLELYVLNFEGNENELRIIHDNFPMKRRGFSTNIPFRNIEDFEAMFKRMKIELPPRKALAEKIKEKADKEINLEKTTD